MILRFFQAMKMLALHYKVFQKLLSFLPLGRLAFRISILIKRLSLLYGSWSQRAIEYPWVLRQLRLLKPGSIVLDVGCAESLLSHELVARKYKVVGIDIREYPFKNNRMLFIKRNILCSNLPSEIFDGIIVVSTIEHIGLSAYGQNLLDDKGDIKAMKEFYRLLKPGGIILITTPYVGDEPFRISSFERNYNRERLTELIREFNVDVCEYFYPLRHGKRLIWVKLDQRQINKKTFREPGLACLVLVRKH